MPPTVWQSKAFETYTELSLMKLTNSMVTEHLQHVCLYIYWYLYSPRFYSVLFYFIPNK